MNEQFVRVTRDYTITNDKIKECLDPSDSTTSLPDEML